MYKSILGLCLICLTSVYAGVINEAHLKFNVQTGQQVTSESIDVNYANNYVKISSPAHENAQSVVMLHDYLKDVNVMKKGDNCFLLDHFYEVPENIEDWETLRSDMGSDSAQLDGEGILTMYQLRVLPFFVDRLTLPDSVQTLCPGPIRILIQDDSLDDDEDREPEEQGEEESDGDNDAEEEEEEDGDYAEIFLPLGNEPQGNSRVKRQSLLNRFRTGTTLDGRHTLQTRPNSRGWFGGVEGRWGGSIRTSPVGLNFGRERFRGGRGWSWQVGAGSSLRGNVYGRVGFRLRW